MHLPRIAIENHQFTLILIILLVLTGIVSFITMPRSEDPQVAPAGSSVIVVYPGATPGDMEEMVISPLEEVINELEDIKYIRASATDGLGVITTEFISGTDPDDKYSDVVQKVNSVRNNLPEDISELEIIKWSISDVQILQLALVSETSAYADLQREAERLKMEFEKVGGIKKVKLWAYPEREVRISVNMEKMAETWISLTRLIGAIQSANSNIPGGYVDVGQMRFNIRTSGSYQSLEEIRNTVIAGAENHLLYLKDVADVSFADEEKSYYARYNGQKAIFITASQKPGTNIFDIRENLETKIDEFKERLPQSLKLETVFDQAESVAFRLNGFFLNLLQGLALVGIIILLAVGMRAALIVILAIPISILIGVGFLDMSEYGLEQMSIAGLVIALGLLVDNAIVVIENISRYIRNGLSRTEAAILGTGQIGWAITSSTLTTVFAFLPIMMMQNITGEFIRSMPLTVVYTLMASLLIALILTPYLSSKFLAMGDLNRKRWLRDRLNSEIETHYRRSLAFVLAHPARTLVVVGMVFIVSLSLFPLVGISFFPKAEKPQFIINVNTPEGTNIGQTERVTEFVDSLLQTEPAVRHYALNIGHGNPRIYYNVIPQKNSSRHAQFFVTLKDRDQQVYDQVIKELRQATGRYPGARIEIKEFEQGPPVEAPIAIRLLGDNLSTLKEIAARAEKIITETPGTVNVNNPLGTSRTDIEIKINREKAGILGVPLVDIDRTIRASVAGLVVGKYRDNEGEEYNLLLRLFEGEKFNHRDFERIYISSLRGQSVPLGQIATVRFVASPQAIDHYDLERNVTITADVEGNLSVDAVTAEILSRLARTEMPRGYRVAVGGELEKREESFGGMFRAVLIALIGIFAVLVLQFRSYSQPLIVFSAIPLAIIGSMFALLITGYSFSFTAFIGLTSLVGIVVNNSIILVDYANQLRREGRAVVAALKEAGEVRFIPIVLTTATTIGGLLPLTLGGGSLWAPMGWTIIGGLLVSTVLTLLVVPVLYKLFSPEEAAVK